MPARWSWDRVRENWLLLLLNLVHRQGVSFIKKTLCVWLSTCIVVCVCVCGQVLPLRCQILPSTLRPGLCFLLLLYSTSRLWATRGSVFTSQLAIGAPRSQIASWLNFTWVLGIWTLVLIFAWLEPYPLSHFLSPLISYGLIYLNFRL